MTIQKNDMGSGQIGGLFCGYAMIVDRSWYNFSSPDLYGDAFLRRNAAALGGCPEAGEPTPEDFACVSNNSVCVERRVRDYSMAHLCSCSAGYEGNPYSIQGGCQGISSLTLLK